MAANGGHDTESVVNHQGHSVKNILGDVHGKFLFQAGLPDPEGLHVAAENDDADVVRSCLALKTDVNSRNEEGLTAIGLAAYFNSVEAIDALAAARADPNVSGNDGASPLILAVHEGHTEAVQTLVKAYAEESNNANDGAGGGDAVTLDMSHRMNGDYTALYLACQEGHAEAVDALLSTQAGRDAIEICKKTGASPLFVRDFFWCLPAGRPAADATLLCSMRRQPFG